MFFYDLTRYMITNRNYHKDLRSVFLPIRNPIPCP